MTNNLSLLLCKVAECVACSVFHSTGATMETNWRGSEQFGPSPCLGGEDSAVYNMLPSGVTCSSSCNVGKFPHHRFFFGF